MNDHAKSFKEVIGVVIAAFIVACFVGLGFVQVAVFLWTDKTIAFDSDWKISIYGLANIAFGFLIGAKLTQGPISGSQSAVVETAENVNVAAPIPPVATRRPEIKP